MESLTEFFRAMWIRLSADPVPPISVLVAVCAIFFYYWQVRAMKRSSQLASIQKILEYVDNIELRRARHFTYRHPEIFRDLATEPFTWDNADKLDVRIRKESEGKVSLEDIEVWVNALNNIGFLVRRRFAPRRIIKHHLKNTYLHCWEVLSPFVEFRRNKARRSNSNDTRLVPADVSSYHHISSTYGKHFVWVVKQIKNGWFGLNDAATKKVFTEHPVPREKDRSPDVSHKG